MIKYFMNDSKRSIIIYSMLIVFTILLGICIRNVLFTFVIVEGNSMSPTMNDGDIIFINKWSKKFKANDIVIFKINDFKDLILIKRIIGPAHSRVYIDNFRVYLNDQLLSEKKMLWNFDAFECRYSSLLKSAASEVIVLGDNRCNSFDSRAFGSIPEKNILGKVITIIPLTKLFSFSVKNDL